jgi:hypothetical protein
MEIDNRFPTKLNTVSDVPEPLRSALLKGLPSEGPIRLLVHAPAFSSGDEITPATVFAVTDNGWLVASETEDSSATLVKSEFGDTLFLQVGTILLSGQLRISFASGDALQSVAIKFEPVEDECYREAIHLILGAIDPAHSVAAGKDQHEASEFEDWPMKFRNEVQRYWGRSGQLLVARHWPAVVDESQRQLAPAGALAITERDLVLISDEREPGPTEEVVSGETPSEPSIIPDRETTGGELSDLPADLFEFGENITVIPRVRLAEFQVSHQEDFSVLTLQVRSTHGGGKLEVLFPSGDEKAVSQAMERALLPGGSATFS